jgi:hypothetical protein
MRRLAAKNRSKVIDLLIERLEFERASVERCDLVLEALRPRGGPWASILGHLRLIREEEKEHEEWLEEQVKALGGDPHEESDAVRALLNEWRLIIEGEMSSPDPAHLFQALLKAELLDNGGWELLLALAEQANDEEASQAFRQRLHEEQEHLLFVGRIVARLARSEVLDEAVTLMEEASA